MTIHLFYFAQLREEMGCAEQTIETSARTPALLFEEVSRAVGLTISRDQLSVAVNEKMADWETALSDGDTVVFLTPFGGG